MKQSIALCVLALAACAEPEPAAAPPPKQPAADQPFYVGRWATSLAECDSKAWTITQGALQAPEGACDFTRTQPITAGFEAEAQCRWGAEAAPARIQMAYAQSAQALLLSGLPGGDVGLVACEAH